MNTQRFLCLGPPSGDTQLDLILLLDQYIKYFTFMRFCA